MRKLKLGKRGLSPLVAVIVLLTLVMVLGAIIAGTLSGAPRPVMPAVTAVNLMAPKGGNPAADDTTLILRHEYGQVIDDAYVSKACYGDDAVYWEKMVMLINGAEVQATWHPGEEPIVVVVPWATATLETPTPRILYTAVEPGAAGNEISVAHIDPGIGDSPLHVEVDGKFIQVYLRTRYSYATLATGTEADDNLITYKAKARGPGGNEISIEYTNEIANTELIVTVDGKAISVELADPYEFQTEGNGTAEWSTEKAHSGSYSALLTVPEGGVTNAARVTMPSPVATVNDISSVSVEYYLTADSTTNSSPYIILELDSDGDEVGDDWAVSWQDDGVATETWLTHTPTGSVWHVVSISGSQQSPLTLEELKDAIGTKTILKVKAAVGEWGFTGKTSAYVDDLTVNGVTYDLEPIVSTAAEVKSAIMEWGSPSRALVYAISTGAGLVAPMSQTYLSGGDEYEFYGNYTRKIRDAVNAHPDASALVTARIIDYSPTVGEPMLQTYLSGGVDIVYQEMYDFELGDMIVIDLPTPLESNDLIQLLWEPRDLMLVEYLVQ